MSSQGVRHAQAADDLLGLFTGLDACTVSDALDALDLPGSVLGLSPMWEGARLVGRARTVRLAEGPPPPGQPPVHLGARAVDAGGPGDVVVVDNAGRTGMGAWGGLLSAAAALKGLAGVVVDGACRDVDEARDLTFPVFARSSVVRTARSRVHEESSGRPVVIGDVAVTPGDIVVADGSGVVVVAQSVATQVVARARQIASREALMQADLRNGRSVSDVLGSSYEDMLRPGTPR